MDGWTPIETRYNGYLFRSRLEARYAVLLGHLSIRYAYEDQGYELPTGDRYLPDFWLPDLEYFAEVKGPEPNDTELRKASGLAAMTGLPVFMLVGTPGDEKVLAVKHDVPSEWVRLGWCRACSRWDFSGMRGHDVIWTQDLADAYVAARSARFEWESYDPRPIRAG
jgi:hypothetical protein